MLLRPRMNDKDPLRLGLKNSNLSLLNKDQLVTIYRKLATVYKLPLLYNGSPKRKIIEDLMSQPTLKMIFRATGMQ